MKEPTNVQAKTLGVQPAGLDLLERLLHFLPSQMAHSCLRMPWCRWSRRGSFCAAAKLRVTSEADGALRSRYQRGEPA